MAEDQPNQPSNQKASKTLADRPAIRVVVNLFMIAILGVLAVLVWQRVISGRAEPEPVTPTVTQATPPQAPKIPDQIALAPFDVQSSDQMAGITRQLDFQTLIPERPQVNVITYTVQKGDTLFQIADKFKIKPETVLWGNYEVLTDNPHLLKPDQILNILPIDGTYYQWHTGDNLSAVASFFKVEPQAILDFTGNHFDLTDISSGGSGLSNDQWLVIPGGKRAIKDWGPPAITRNNPASARYYGEGSCGTVYSGAVGTGIFVLPTVTKSISGYGYSDIHPAVDFAGAEGNAVFAADSGVVVFAGWSNYGYGYLIVIDHGNGFQTAYAHLSAVAVTCGQSVFQGGYIGAVGNTGNSTGAHLHFELIYNGAKPNPLDYLP